MHVIETRRANDSQENTPIIKLVSTGVQKKLTRTEH